MAASKGRRNVLDQLGKIGGAAAPELVVETNQESEQKSEHDRPSRRGKKALGAHFDPVVVKELKILAAKQDRTLQSLVGESLNLLFEKYGVDTIAPE